MKNLLFRTYEPSDLRTFGLLTREQSPLLVLDHLFQVGETCLSPFQLGETCLSPFQLGETCVSAS